MAPRKYYPNKKENIVQFQPENVIEIYESKVQELTEEYMQQLPDPEALYKNNKMMFNGLIKYIYLHYFKKNKPNYADADALEAIWDTYTSLCYSFNKKPSIMNFSIYSGIDCTVMFEWMNNTNRIYIYYDDNNNIINNVGRWKLEHPGREPRRELSGRHSLLMAKMRRETESALADGCAEQNSVGCMFLLKSKYGYRETAPIPAPETHGGALTAADLPTLQGVSAPELPEPPTEGQILLPKTDK